MLNIVHCDLKPDNMMYDPATSTVKIMDFGNAIDQDQDYRHEGIQAAGMHYLPDEAGQTGNTHKVDLYAVGIIIASLYADRCYMAERIDRWENDSPEKIMDDVLGADVTSKAGMPADLFAIVRHLTQANPDNRPENIALANGVSNSNLLSDITVTQTQAAQLRQGYMASANAKNVSQEVKDALAQHKDLTTIRNEFAQLLKKPGLDNATRSYLTSTIPVIDRITNSQAKTLQAGRAQEVHSVYQATNITHAESTINVVKQLEALAAAHRVKAFGGIVSFSRPYDEVGKIIKHSVDQIKADKDYPKIEPVKMKVALEILSAQVIEMGSKRLEKEQGTMKTLQTLRDGIIPDQAEKAVRNRR